VEVTFKPQAANGLIFYSSQYRNGSGSYLLAQLQNYQFFLGLDAGAGPVTIRYISFYPALEKTSWETLLYAIGSLSI